MIRGKINMKIIKKLIFTKDIRINLAILLFALTLVLSLTMFHLQKKKIMIKMSITVSQDFQNLFITGPFFLDKKPDFEKWFNFIIERISEKFIENGYKFFDHRLAYFPREYLNENRMFSIEKKNSSVNLILYLEKENSYQNTDLVKNQIKNVLIKIVSENGPLHTINGIYDFDEIYILTEDEINKNNNNKKNTNNEYKLQYLQFIISEYNNRKVTDKYPIQIVDYLVENKWNNYFYYFIYCFHSSILIYILFFLIKNKKRK